MKYLILRRLAKCGIDNIVLERNIDLFTIGGDAADLYVEQTKEMYGTEYAPADVASACVWMPTMVNVIAECGGKNKVVRLWATLGPGKDMAIVDADVYAQGFDARRCSRVA